jgi:dTDP-4-dehydrorhamnose reductase
MAMTVTGTACHSGTRLPAESLPMKILVTGRDGQLGWELARSLQALGPVTAVGRSELDLADWRTVAARVAAFDADVVVNAAAYTAVDGAETEVERALDVNARAVGQMASACAASGATLLHFSTDYVYDGRKSEPYVETDPTGPLSMYGRSKLEGEHAIVAAGCAHAIFRTSWVYAIRGSNFLRTMLRLARDRETLRIVDDQHGAPTWARSLAEATAAVLARAGCSRADVCGALQQRGGVFHMSNAGSTTWHGFARRIFDEIPDPARALGSLVPIPAREYPTPATRPSNSVLDNGRLAREWGVQLPAWHDALRLCAADMAGAPRPT